MNTTTAKLEASPSLNPAVKVRLRYVSISADASTVRTFGVRRQGDLYYPFESFNGRGDYRYFGEHGTLKEAVEQLERLVGVETTVSPINPDWRMDLA